MIKCFNSNIEIYSDNNYNYNNWNLINNKGLFTIYNNTSNRVDLCISQTGNVGIGSTNPVSKMDVVGDVSIIGKTTISSNLVVNNRTLTTPIAQFGNNLLVQSNIYIFGGTSARIGIGSSAPKASLDILGTANISGIITANGGLTVPEGQTLNVLGNIQSTVITTETLNVANAINANGGIILPYGNALLADGGTYTSFLNATEMINATGGLTVFPGSLLTANGGISATTITASGLLTANNGLTIPATKVLTANGGISATNIETSGTILAKTATLTTPVVQFGSNVSASSNIYFVGGGRARIGIGSSAPTASLDVLGNANISGAINANTIGVVAGISANSLSVATTISANSLSTTTAMTAGGTITAGGIITANAGITVPSGSRITADGGIVATTISASGMITATNGITANTINSLGLINTVGGIISDSTITSFGLISANAGLNASTITSLGIINADAGISATTISSGTIQTTGLIQTQGGLSSTTITASGLITANNGVTASSINSLGTIVATNAVSTAPLVQIGTNANSANNLYFVGGGNARIGIGSSSPSVSLDVVGLANISGRVSANDGISTTTINASGLITAPTLNVLSNIVIGTSNATIPITQIGTNVDTASNIYFIGGGTSRIGIGVSSPSYAMEIAGDTNITGIYRKNNRDVFNDTSNYVLSTSNLISTRLNDHFPYTWRINSYTSNLYYSLGNVGIGVTEPVKKLHIRHPSNELLRIESATEGANQVSGIEFGIPSYNTATRSKITSTTYVGNASDLQFSTVSSINNSIPQLIISPYGCVGIGTPNPLNILQIGSGGRLRIANNNNDYTVIGTADADDITNTKIELSGRTRTGSQGAVSGEISYVTTTINGHHRFITSSATEKTERMRITSAGNVGIGTTTPEELLTLYGSNTILKIKNSLDSGKSVAINLENGSNSSWIICNSNNSLSFDFNNSNRITIEGTRGNIGIGTKPYDSGSASDSGDSGDYILNILGNARVGGNIVPASSNTYNLGSATNKWKNLYLSGSSIYLDDLVLSRDSNINLNVKDLLGNYKDACVSNIQLNNNSSNTLKIGIDGKGNIVYSTSNKIYYPVTTTNINNTEILDNVNKIILDTSNYAIETSNILSERITTFNNRQSNYVLSTSNLISKRITELTTDMINENIDGKKKFIINNRYNDDLLINGTLTINSNLIVLGENTLLETTVYTTERMEIVNENNTSVALMVKQADIYTDIFVASNLTTDVFKITNNGDVHINGSGNYMKNNRDVFNDTSNYIQSTSNNLINYANRNDINNSNYTTVTSNILYNNIAYVDSKLMLLTLKVNLNDNNSSNYTLATSNTLIAKANFNDNNSSNYTLATSNTLIAKANFNDNNSSNYTLATSNTLIAKANFNDNNSSNYTLATSNTLIAKANFNDNNSSNYTLATSNTLIAKANFNDNNSSNYTLQTSNLISKRITDLMTDMITENIDASNKFIVNNSYNNNLLVNGSLTINSNLIVLGDTTNLDTIVYTTERLEVINANNSTTAMMIQQKTNDRDIFIASNLNTGVFRIANDGDVHIHGSGVYKRNNRDVILDTSNYVLATSNTLIAKANFNDNNSSNYTLQTSNLISKRITDLMTDMITENIDASNKFIVNNSYNNNLLVNGSLTINSNLIVLGDTTNLDTIVYTTERLEVINANNTTTAMMIQQKTNDRDIFIASNLNTGVFRIANDGDVHIHGSGVYKRNNRDVILDTSNYTLATSNTLIAKANFNDNNASNYTLATSNTLIAKANFNDNNASNYTLATSNTLIAKANFNDNNASNYTLATSNTLIAKANFNDNNASNYTLATSNTLIAKANFNDNNASNYTLATSNTLIAKANFNDSNTSNYIYYTSNNLIHKADFNDSNTSNYIYYTSNNLIHKADFNDSNTSNYIYYTSNNLIHKADFNDSNSSNYTLYTSNIISKRITELVTDMITEEISASNKFIVNNRYNNNLELNGTLTINSNLIVLGDTTQLDTILYTTERLEVVNTNNTTNAFMVQQNSADRDIFVASNMDTAVFRIANNGDVNINGSGVYKRNNRDVILDTSNYVLATSNTLINKADFNDENASNYVLATSNTLVAKANFNDKNTSNYIYYTSNNLINKADFNDENASNYVLATSNIISKRITELMTDMITEDISATNKFIVNNSYNNNLLVNGSLTINSNLIVLGDTTQLDTILYTTERLEVVNANNSTTAFMVQQNSADRDIFVASNMDTAVFRIANNGDVNISGIGSSGVYKRNNRDVILDTSNYVLATSNTLINKADFNDNNSSNYTLATSNTLINKADFNDLNASNYVLATSNTLINKANFNDLNASNYVLATSNTLVAKANFNDENASNYVLATSNTLVAKANFNDENASNYVLATSNTLINKANFNDENASNYVLATSNTLVAKANFNDLNASNYVLATSNTLVAKANFNDENASNYVLATSNTLVAKANFNDENASNYVLATSNTLVEKANFNDENASNYVLATSNTLVAKANFNDLNASNYVLATSNLISKRITELTTDMITEKISASNKFIVNNKYNNNLEVNGTLTINSNLIVLGDTTQLETNVYTTERLEVVNANNASTAFLVQQNTVDGDIFVASNMTTCVFRIANNGDVHINGAGVYKKDNRDVIWDTSNYVSAIEESLIDRINNATVTQINYITVTSSNLGDGLSVANEAISINDINTSNYVHSTSNIIQQRINEITTDKIVEGAKNRFIIENRYNSNLLVQGNLVVSSNLVVNQLATLNNSLNITGDVNFTGDIYKNGMIYPNGKTYTGSSSILSQFSPIQTQFNMYKNVVEKTGVGWQFIDNNINVVDDKVQGFCVRIKPNHYSSKLLINLNCHIGIDYGTDARWWGLRLYRKIGEAGEWTHISGADGTDYNNNNGTTCWLSHNLGAESSTYSYFIANISGAYYDIPGISEDYIYYTVKWCSLLGDNTQNGKLYLNRPAVISSLNAPVVSSSWNISEIWQLETSYFPKGGIVTKYTPTQTQFNIYKNVVEKTGGGWQFIDNDTSITNNNIAGFCVRIRPSHYSSKILINLTCHIGIDYGTDARWWGLRLYRKIGEGGTWTHIADADGSGAGGSSEASGSSGGTPCWLSHNLGAESSTYSYFIANVSGAYYDVPNAMDTDVYYTVQWCSQLGDATQNGKLYLNRPATYNNANGANSAVLSSSWNAQEIWQLETTFIPKNAVICQNMSIQTLFNIYRNIVIKSGNGWQFIDNDTNIINDKIQGFCVRIKPTHPSSKVLVHISCHIGIDYGTDARWWGLRLYRKIGEAGTWTHITDADGNNLIDNQGTSCWLSHNLGAESSTSSYFVANISGSFFDLPGTSSDFVYYTAKWCSILGDNSQEGKIYLNRPATYNDSNSAVLSSSWNAQEIWQLGTPYEPAEYSIINIFNNNNVGIGTTNPVSKLDVNGTINAVNYSTISDRRYKKDIKAVDSSLELINKLDPVSYLTIEQNEGERRNFGFIAQDLHSLIPEAVNVPLNDNNNYTIEYMSLIPLLTKSIQELTEKINRQQATIDYLSSRLHD